MHTWNTWGPGAGLTNQPNGPWRITRSSACIGAFRCGRCVSRATPADKKFVLAAAGGASASRSIPLVFKRRDQGYHPALTKCQQDKEAVICRRPQGGEPGKLGKQPSHTNHTSLQTPYQIEQTLNQSEHAKIKRVSRIPNSLPETSYLFAHLPFTNGLNYQLGLS